MDLIAILQLHDFLAYTRGRFNEVYPANEITYNQTCENFGLRSNKSRGGNYAHICELCPKKVKSRNHVVKIMYFISINSNKLVANMSNFCKLENNIITSILAIKKNFAAGTKGAGPTTDRDHF